MAGRRGGLRRALALVAALACAGGAHAGLADALFGGNVARITRTGHGVAHVEAADEESLGYGLGYAWAQDNACAAADLLVTVRGERSFWFGAETSGTLGTRALPNRVADFFVRSHMDDEKIAYAWRQAPPDAQARARGFVGGFDRWLEDARDRLPAECRGKPWVKPMTEAELRRVGELVMVETGAAAWADAIFAAQPPRPDGKPTRPPWLPTPPVADSAAAVDDPPFAGSNAFAFGGDSSAGGRGLLLANPHFPWSGVNRFWQAHVTIPGRLDAMGAMLGPLPWIAVGFNASLAWTRTAAPGTRFTLHELALVPGNPLAYLVDGKPETMTARSVRISERGPDGQMQTTQQTQFSTRYGPVVVVPTLGLLWTPSTAVALQDVDTYAARYAETWPAIERAADIDALRAALARQGSAWMSTVAAGRDGRVLFAYSADVPDVESGRLVGCVSTRFANTLWREHALVLLDGSRAACDWPRDPAAALPGAIAPARMPLLERRDWVQDAGGFWLANPAAPLTGFSPLAGQDGVPQRLETRMAMREVAARLGGRDTKDAGRMSAARPSEGARTEVRSTKASFMSADDLSALLFAHRNFAATLVLGDLLNACHDAPSEATRAACTVLASWDRTDAAGSRGAQVFREFWRRARGVPGLWRVPFDRRDPLHTPAGLDMASEKVRNTVFDALGQGVHAIRGARFTIDAPLGTLQARTVAGRIVQLPGGEEGEGVLGAFGVSGVTPLTSLGYDIDEGTSYLQLVDFDADGPVARGLLLYGQSPHVDSPFAFDQLADFAQGRWLDLPFKAEDVQAQRVGAPLTLHFRPLAGR